MRASYRSRVISAIIIALILIGAGILIWAWRSGKFGTKADVTGVDSVTYYANPTNFRIDNLNQPKYAESARWLVSSNIPKWDPGVPNDIENAFYIVPNAGDPTNIFGNLGKDNIWMAYSFNLANPNGPSADLTSVVGNVIAGGGAIYGDDCFKRHAGIDTASSPFAFAFGCFFRKSPTSTSNNNSPGGLNNPMYEAGDMVIRLNVADRNMKVQDLKANGLSVRAPFDANNGSSVNVKINTSYASSNLGIIDLGFVYDPNNKDGSLFKVDNFLDTDIVQNFTLKTDINPNGDPNYMTASINSIDFTLHRNAPRTHYSHSYPDLPMLQSVTLIKTPPVTTSTNPTPQQNTPVKEPSLTTIENSQCSTLKFNYTRTDPNAKFERILGDLNYGQPFNITPESPYYQSPSIYIQDLQPVNISIASCTDESHCSVPVAYTQKPVYYPCVAKPEFKVSNLNPNWFTLSWGSYLSEINLYDLYYLPDPNNYNSKVLIKAGDANFRGIELTSAANDVKPNTTYNYLIAAHNAKFYSINTLSVKTPSTPPVACTSYNTGEANWGQCVNGKQYLNQPYQYLPQGCSVTQPVPGVAPRDCQNPPQPPTTPQCTGYNFTWSACQAGPGGQGTQSPLNVAGIPTGCSGGATPPTSQSCTIPPTGNCPTVGEIRCSNGASQICSTTNNWTTIGSCIADTPGVPQNVKAEMKNLSDIKVSWDPVGNNISGYIIYDAGTNQPIRFVNASTTSTVFEKLICDRDYSFYVRSAGLQLVKPDGTLNLSGNSNTAAAKTQKCSNDVGRQSISDGLVLTSATGAARTAALVSTGTQLWFNVLAGVILSAIIAYFLLRRRPEEE